MLLTIFARGVPICTMQDAPEFSSLALLSRTAMQYNIHVRVMSRTPVTLLCVTLGPSCLVVRLLLRHGVSNSPFCGQKPLCAELH